jgi:hypothetical protein
MKTVLLLRVFKCSIPEWDEQDEHQLITISAIKAYLSGTSPQRVRTS